MEACLGHFLLMSASLYDVVCHLFTQDEIRNCLPLISVSWAHCTHPQGESCSYTC